MDGIIIELIHTDPSATEGGRVRGNTYSHKLGQATALRSISGPPERCKTVGTELARC